MPPYSKRLRIVSTAKMIALTAEMIVLTAETTVLTAEATALRLTAVSPKRRLKRSFGGSIERFGENACFGD